ncbi:DUF3489 domain-containing protein [Roseomonas sp. BN140053]|uniref:DUF3489 domain-containing protein n=1 Tax=Roseomonas sp. BN140053 TaxID=3391898 RepID=UPI0039E73BC0
MVKQSHIATLPDIPAPPRQAVIASLLKTGLRAYPPALAEEAERNLHATDVGLTSIGADLREGRTAGASTHTPAGLRAAAQAVLAAWNAQSPPDALAAGVEQLRNALARKPAPTSACGPRVPRTGTKRATVLALLRRPEGATGAQVVEATGWAPHTVRGFLAGLKRRGTAVEVLDRVRQVGPGRAGAKGSYTVYRVAEVG